MKGVAFKLRRCLSAIFRSCSVWLALCFVYAGPALAHKASDAYLQLSSAASSPTISWQLSLALRDVDAAIDSLDQDNDRNLNWGEIQQSLPAIKSLITENLQTRCGDLAMPLNWSFESLEQRSDGAYVRFGAASACRGSQLNLQYELLKNIDASHRLLVGGALHGQALAAVVSPNTKPLLTISASPANTSAGGAAKEGRSFSAGLSAFTQFFPEGVHHLATGYDHLAFLLALLLPIMLRKTAMASDDHCLAHRPGVWSLLRTVTGFTIGHSITLVLASLGWIASPAWVEPAIAISIGVSALLNLYPQRWLRSDYLALGFGLIHGLGFSNIMREANISGDLLPWALAGFNLGVEAGQLVGVALWCGVHWVLVRWHRYDQVVVRGGSWALCGLALFWAVQRLAGQ
jgi:HupE / UreJ protein